MQGGTPTRTVLALESTAPASPVSIHHARWHFPRPAPPAPSRPWSMRPTLPQLACLSLLGLGWPECGRPGRLCGPRNPRSRGQALKARGRARLRQEDRIATPTPAARAWQPTRRTARACASTRSKPTGGAPTCPWRRLSIAPRNLHSWHALAHPAPRYPLAEGEQTVCPSPGAAGSLGFLPSARGLRHRLPFLEMRHPASPRAPRCPGGVAPSRPRWSRRLVAAFAVGSGRD